MAEGDERREHDGLQAHETVRPDASIRLLRPFTFDAENYGSFLGVEQVTWRLGTKTHPVWEPRPVSADDFAPALAGFVNGPPGISSCNAFRMTRSVLDSPHGFGAAAPWAFRRRRIHLEIVIRSVELILFRSGIGFLVIGLAPAEDDLDGWFDLCHFARFTDASGRSATLEPRDPLDTALWRPAGAEPSTTVWELSQRLLAEVVPGDEIADPFLPTQLLAYTIAFVESAAPVMEIVYRGRNFFRSAQSVRASSPDLDPSNPSQLEYSEGQFFHFSLDGGGFIAVNAPATDFNRAQLPDHLEGPYFMLFLFAMHQHFALSQLAKRITECWAVEGEADRRRTFRSIFDDLLDFTARGHLSQAMQRDHHHRVYRRWYETLRVGESYDEIRRSMRDMLDYTQLLATEADAEVAKEDSRRQQRFELRLARWTLLLAPPAMVLALLGVNISGFSDGNGIAPTTVALSLLLAIAFGAAAAAILGRRPLPPSASPE